MGLKFLKPQDLVFPPGFAMGGKNIRRSLAKCRDAVFLLALEYRIKAHLYLCTYFAREVHMPWRTRYRRAS